MEKKAQLYEIIIKLIPISNNCNLRFWKLKKYLVFHNLHNPHNICKITKTKFNLKNLFYTYYKNLIHIEY